MVLPKQAYIFGIGHKCCLYRSMTQLTADYAACHRALIAVLLLLATIGQNRKQSRIHQGQYLWRKGRIKKEALLQLENGS